MPRGPQAALSPLKAKLPAQEFRSTNIKQCKQPGNFLIKSFHASTSSLRGSIKSERKSHRSHRHPAQVVPGVRWLPGQVVLGPGKPQLMLPLPCSRGWGTALPAGPVRLRSPWQRPSHCSLFSGILTSCRHQGRDLSTVPSAQLHQREPASQLKTRPAAGDCQTRPPC